MSSFRHWAFSGIRLREPRNIEERLTIDAVKEWVQKKNETSLGPIAPGQCLITYRCAESYMIDEDNR